MYVPIQLARVSGTPYHIQPLGFPGVTAVIHAATKYLGGHSDLTAGTVSSNDRGMLSQMATAQKLFGAPLPGFDSFLLVSVAEIHN